MPQSTINYTPEDWPYLDLDNYIETVPNYTTALAARLGTLKGDVSTMKARELFGTGKPNGSVTAAPGTYYTDTSGHKGAWRWLKTIGTGNTGWQVVHGDTGWIPLSDWSSSGTVIGDPLPAGAAPTPNTAGSVRGRRIGNWVYWHLRGLTISSRTVTWNLPPGLRQSRLPYARGEDMSDANQTVLVMFGYQTLTLNAPGTVPYVINSLRGVDITGITDEAWPA